MGSLKELPMTTRFSDDRIAHQIYVVCWNYVLSEFQKKMEEDE